MLPECGQLCPMMGSLTNEDRRLHSEKGLSREAGVCHVYRSWRFAHVGRLKSHCRKRHIGFPGQSGTLWHTKDSVFPALHDFLKQNDRMGSLERLTMSLVCTEGTPGSWRHLKRQTIPPSPLSWPPALVVAKLLVPSSFFCAGLPQPSLPFHLF